MDVFSNLMVIGECLLDARRTQAFQNAINHVVKADDIVMDVGTGSGIMAMFAAQAGAKKVYAVELAPEVAKFATQNIKANNLESVIEVINADAKHLPFSASVNVVIMELMDTGLVAEHQAQAINNLHNNHLINDLTRLIPYRYQCAFELIEYDFDFYGLHMPFVVQARNFAVSNHIKQRLSDTAIYRDINFHQPVTTQVDEHINVEISQAGLVNALLLKSRTFLSPKNIVWGTTDLNMPVVIPLKPITARLGQKLSVHLFYNMGEGFENFAANVDG